MVTNIILSDSSVLTIKFEGVIMNITKKMLKDLIKDIMIYNECLNIAYHDILIKELVNMVLSLVQRLHNYILYYNKGVDKAFYEYGQILKKQYEPSLLCVYIELYIDKVKKCYNL